MGGFVIGSAGSPCRVRICPPCPARADSFARSAAAWARAPRREGPPQIDPVARIDALTATGRANWFALLAYLAFALITTLGVEDVDFFVDSRQTQLSLVNVSIPTFSFFVFAPILGAALYAYLHLHIRKVTEPLAEAPQPAYLKAKRQAWCTARGYVEGADPDCAGFFARIEQDFDVEWITYRKALIALIAKPDLRGKDLRRALLSGAELSGIDFRGALMQGANLGWAGLQSVKWQGAKGSASLAHSADFRGSTGLMQELLSTMIGNPETLLPDTRDAATGESLFVPSCWPFEPKGWHVLVGALARNGMTEERMRAEFLCAPGEAPRKTGTPWPLDRDPPWVEDPGWMPQDRGEMVIYTPTPAPPKAFAPPAL
ncbi:pentapeptide repeat-containing protein [Paracoccus marinaquae]|uniref:Pentapeptide repeat-containing protein n=1 Tax=Paracoccus marinaquae TaxID=2841926 RepID=A0ABS6AGS0_9RHOB|nr:pentapeptide repeat-containing protein [Paracoccus marinaquae]MBU3029789.1 pentapeptide repeat-containing protein [Paracoccus marinaquae]